MTRSATEQEAIDFYDLYKGGNKTQQPPTPRFAFTPCYGGGGAQGPSELPNGEEVVLLENALALAFASREASGARYANGSLTTGDCHWQSSSKIAYGSKSAEGVSDTERLGHQSMFFAFCFYDCTPRGVL